MKCPACGYDPNIKKRPSMEVIQMLSKRGDKCIKLIKEISNKIMTGIPSDNSYFKYYLFIKGINNIEDEYIITSIANYKYNRRYRSGRGFSYLREMIKNCKFNRGKLLENEYKIVGKSPSRITLKENFNGKKKKRKAKVKEPK